MDYNMLCKKREQLKQLYERIPKEALQSFEKSFEIEYTHNSTAIEGNTLSLVQTKAVLEDGLSVGGKTLREIYEVVNHKKAFDYVKKCVAEGKALDEKIIKNIHALLLENILTGEIYRNVEVRITGAMHKPPVPTKMYEQVKNFYADMQYAAKENRLEYFEALETYAMEGGLKSFANMIAELEEQRLDEYLGITQEQENGPIINM